MEGPETDFATAIERIATKPVDVKALRVFRLATHLGIATAKERGIVPEAPAHWRSLLGALLLTDDPASRWLQWGARQGWLRIDAVLPRAAADRADALREANAGNSAPSGPSGWFTSSAHAQITEASHLVPSSPGEHNDIPGLHALAVLDVPHLLAALILAPVGDHVSELAEAAPDLQRLQRHVALWVADGADGFARGAPDVLGLGKWLEGASLPTLTPALEEVTALPGGVEAETVRPMGAEEDRLVGIMAGPLRRALVQDRRSAASADWPELLVLLGDILEPNIGLGAGASRPPFKPVPFTGHGYTILVRAGVLAARTSASQPVDLRHLLGAALAANSDVLPPAPLAWAGWRQSDARPDPISNKVRIRFLDLIRRHNSPGSAGAGNLAAWTDLILGERLVTARIATDTPPIADLLDFHRYADAFASIIADREVTPPLAIGLFGHWGSGKSAMIGMIDAGLAVIDQRAAFDPTQRFSRGIVRVLFNAWHYAEANLWASLLVRIFEELNRHLGTAEKEPPGAERAQALLALDAALLAQRTAEMAVAGAEHSAAAAAAEAAVAATAEAAAREAARDADAARVTAEQAAVRAEGSRREAFAVAGDAAALLLAFGRPAPADLAGAPGEAIVAHLNSLRSDLTAAKEQMTRLNGKRERAENVQHVKSRLPFERFVKASDFIESSA